MQSWRIVMRLYVHCTAPIFVAGPLSHFPRNLFHQSKTSQRFSQLFWTNQKAVRRIPKLCLPIQVPRSHQNVPLLCLQLAEMLSKLNFFKLAPEYFFCLLKLLKLLKLLDDYILNELGLKSTDHNSCSWLFL